MRWIDRRIVAGLVVAFAACGGRTVDSTPDVSARARAHADRTVTRTEIAESGVLTAWEALRLLGPGFEGIGSRSQLRHRGSAVPPLVVLDGVRVGTDVLFAIPASHISTMEFLSPAFAGARYGSGTTGGALVVRTGPLT